LSKDTLIHRGHWGNMISTVHRESCCSSCSTHASGASEHMAKAVLLTMYTKSRLLKK